MSFKIISARIVVKTSLSKVDHEYFTFICPEGSEYIMDYLNERIRKGEKPSPDSTLIIPRNQKIHFISTINIGDQIRDAKWKAVFTGDHMISGTILPHRHLRLNQREPY